MMKNKNVEFEEILKEYSIEFEKGKGFSVLEKHKDWIISRVENGEIKSILEQALEETLRENDLEKYNLVLLIIQAFEIHFSKEDKHFELLFLIANSILQSDSKTINFLLHQLADICIHHSDEIDFLVEKQPKLISNFLIKIASKKYSDSSELGLAVYKSVSLVWHLEDIEAKNILENYFLNHFDQGVVEEAEELIEHLKEEGRF